VAAAANRRENACHPGKSDGFYDVLAIRAISDECWTPINHSVPYGACRVVPLLSSANQRAREAAAERLQSASMHHRFTVSAIQFDCCHGLVSEPCLAAAKLNSALRQGKIEFVSCKMNSFHLVLPP
jgi:hypothetical protein